MTRKRIMNEGMMSASRSTRWLMVVAAAATFIGCAQAQNADQTPISAGPYVIAGTVVNDKTGGLLARTRVTIADAQHRQTILSLVTGADGRFEFHVPAGKFSLEGTNRGFIAGYYNHHDQFSTAIVTGAGFDTENLVLRLAPDAVLTGRVLDESGDPVSGAQVTVYRENRFQGVSRINRYQVTNTDDQGRYEITPLEEGTYFVGVKGDPWYAIHPTLNAEGPAPQVDSALDVVYPITYYGDTTEADDAAAIPIRGGDHLEADIHLNPVPALHILVHATDSEQFGSVLPRLEKPVFDGEESPPFSGFQSVGPGLFELNGVAAGRYTVRARNSNGELQEPTEINLSSGGELDASSGRPTSRITAKIQMEGGGSPPTGLRVGVGNRKGHMSSAVVGPEGVVNLSGVIPGDYEFVAGSPNGSYSVVRVATEAGTFAGHALSVPPGADISVIVTVVEGSATVEGFAKKNGKGTSGAMIVLVPDKPAENHDRFRRDQSDSDGSFSLPQVIPGSYTVIAIANGWDLDWSESAVLSQYMKLGGRLEIPRNPPTTVHLPDPIEVQAR